MDDWGSGFPSGADLNGNGSFDPGDMEIWHDIEKGEYNHKSHSSVTGTSTSANTSGYRTEDVDPSAITGIWWIDIPLKIFLLGFGAVAFIALIGFGIAFPPLGVLMLVMVAEWIKG